MKINRSSSIIMLLLIGAPIFTPMVVNAKDLKSINSEVTNETKDVCSSITADNYDEPQCDDVAVDFVNPDFEEPAISGNNSIVLEDDVPGWNSTDKSTGNYVIELHKSGAYYTCTNQCVELNAYVAGSLYQDFTVQPGQTLYYSFDHLGRYSQPDQTAKLKVGKPLAKEDITDAQNPTAGGEADTVVEDTVAASMGNTVTGVYTVPNDMTEARIAFSAVGGTGTGNGLDNVKFTTKAVYDNIINIEDNNGVNDGYEQDVFTVNNQLTNLQGDLQDDSLLTYTFNQPVTVEGGTINVDGVDYPLDDSNTTVSGNTVEITNIPEVSAGINAKNIEVNMDVKPVTIVENPLNLSVESNFEFYSEIEKATDSEASSYTVEDNAEIEVEYEAPEITYEDNKEIDEEGTPLSDSELITLFNVEATYQGDPLDIEVDQSGVDYSTPGTYPVVFSATNAIGQGVSATLNLIVKDVLPTLTTESDTLTISLGETVDDYIQAYGAVASEIEEGDLTSSIEVDDSGVDYTTAGTYSIVLSATDEEGNEVEKTVELIIDNIEPTISGDTTHEIDEEEPMSDSELITLYNVVAMDAEEGDLTSSIEVDQSGVDYSTPGVYPIVFSVEDTYGEEATLDATIEIKDVLPTLTTENDTLTISLGETVDDYIQAYGAVASEIEEGDLTSSIEVDDSGVDYTTAGTYSVTFSATDEEGNEVEKTVELIIDNIEPTISGDTTHEIDEEEPMSDSELITLYNVVAMDAEEGDLTSSIEVDQSGVDYSTPGVYPIVFSIEDTYGEEATLDATIEIKDVLPTLTTENDTLTISLGETVDDYIQAYGAVASEIEEGDLTSSIEVDDSGVDYTTAGTYSVTFSAVDEEGNEVEKTVELIIDNIEPTISGDTTHEIDEEEPMSDSELITLYNVVAMDVEEGDLTSSIEVDQSGVDYSTPGVYPIVFSVEDTYGEEAILDATIEIKDVLPTLTTESDTLTISLGETVDDYIQAYGAVASEIEEGDLTSSIEVDESGVDYTTAGTYSIVLSATDEEGNEVEKTVELIIDNIEPTISGDTTHEIDEEEPMSDSELITLYNVVAMDAEEGDLTSSIEVDQSGVDYSTPGVYPIVFSVTDEYGEEAILDATIEIKDILPTLTTESDTLTISLGETVDDYIQAYGAVASEIEEGDLTSSIEVDESGVDYTTAGTYSVVFSATDEEGNEVEKTVELIIDNIEPTISGDTTHEIDEEEPMSDSELITLYNVVAMDAEEGDLTSSIEVDQSGVDYSTPGVYPIVFSIEDTYGEEAILDATIEIKDVLPTLTTETDTLTISLGETVDDYIQAYGAVATEISEGDLTSSIVVDDSVVDYTTAGTYSVVFSATDEEGNEVEKTVELIIDNIEPTISGDTTHEIDEEEPMSDSELITLYNVVAMDAEEGDLTSSIEVDQSGVDYSTPGTYPIVFSIEDTYGEEATLDATIEIKDVLPTLTTESDTLTISLGETVDDYIQAYGAVASEINEGDLTSSIVVDDSGVDYTTAGTYSIVLSATDEEGNEVEKTVELIIDNIEPTISGDTTHEIDEEAPMSDSELITLYNVVAMDAEEGDLTSSIEVDQSGVDYSTPGVYPIVFSVEDTYGEEAILDATIEIKDVLPTLTTESDTLTISLGETVDDYIQAYGAVASEISEGDLTSSIEVDDSGVDYTTAGTYSIVLSATDEEGNEVEKTVELIIDNIEPTISGDTTHEIDEEEPMSDSELITLYNVVAMDAEEGDLTSSIEVDQSGVDYSTPGVYPIVFSVEDTYGEEAILNTTIEIKDVLPTLTTENDTLTISLGETVDDYIQAYGAVASEISEGDLTSSIVVDDSGVDYTTAGTYSIVLSATDEEGNEVEKTVELIIDNIEPTISGDTTHEIDEEAPMSDSELITLYNVVAMDAEEGDLTSKVEVDQSGVDYSTPGVYPIVFSVTDEYGEEAILNTTIEIKDVLPTLTTENDTLTISLGETVDDYIQAYGAVASEISEGDLTSSIVVDDSGVDYTTAGTYSIVFSATDEEGNEVEKTVELIIDNIEPTISGDTTHEIDEEETMSDSELITLYNVVAMDAEEGDLTSSIEVDQSGVDYSTPGVYPIVFSVEDTYGEEAILDATIEIKDVLPTLTTESDTLTISLGETVDDYIQAYGAVASEISEGDLTSSIEVDDSGVDYTTAGTYSVVFSAVDEEGNEVEKTVELTINEKEIITKVNEIFVDTKKIHLTFILMSVTILLGISIYTKRNILDK